MTHLCLPTVTPCPSWFIIPDPPSRHYTTDGASPRCLYTTSAEKTRRSPCTARKLRPMPKMVIKAAGGWASRPTLHRLPGLAAVPTPFSTHSLPGEAQVLEMCGVTRRKSEIPSRGWNPRPLWRSQHVDRLHHHSDALLSTSPTSTLPPKLGDSPPTGNASVMLLAYGPVVAAVTNHLPKGSKDYFCQGFSSLPVFHLDFLSFLFPTAFSSPPFFICKSREDATCLHLGEVLYYCVGGLIFVDPILN